MATMMQALMALDDGALGELFRLRPGPGRAPPRPASPSWPTGRRRPRSVQAAVAGLDQFSGVVLQACCVVDDGAGPEAVVALLGGPGRCPPEALDAALAGLAARALLWRSEGGAIHPAPAVHAALGYPLGLGRPLAALAAKSQVTVADLEGALVRLGLHKKQPGERKSDLVARLGVALADPVLVNGRRGGGSAGGAGAGLPAGRRAPDAPGPAGLRPLRRFTVRMADASGCWWRRSTATRRRCPGRSVWPCGAEKRGWSTWPPRDRRSSSSRAGSGRWCRRRRWPARPRPSGSPRPSSRPGAPHRRRR